MKRLESSFLPANFPRSQRAIMLPSKPCDPPTHPQRQVIPRIYLDIDAVIGSQWDCITASLGGTPPGYLTASYLNSMT